MDDNADVMELRALKESQAAMLRVELKSYPDDAFLMAASDLAEVGREMWHFIKEETKRRGLIGNAISLESKDGVRAFICCVTLKELGTYKAAKFLMNRAYERVLELFGTEQAKSVGLMISPRCARFVIECESGCGQYMARFFVESLVKNVGRNGFTVHELKAKV